MARYTRKEFLTPEPNESGSLVLTITTKRVKDHTHWDFAKNSNVNDSVYIEGHMKISDCHQHIHLDFDAQGDRQFDKRIAKFDKMIDEITKMKQQYIAMYENAKRDWEYARDNQEKD